MTITIHTINANPPESPPKFKVGDLVKPSASFAAKDPDPTPWIGEVIWVDTSLADYSRYFYVVKLIEGGHGQSFFYNEDLELAEARQEES